MLAYAETWHTRNPGIFRTLPFASQLIFRTLLCHIYENLRILRTLTYLKPDTYAEPSQKFKMKFFAKIVKSIDIFPKHSILDFCSDSEYAYLSIIAH